MVFADDIAYLLRKSVLQSNLQPVANMSGYDQSGKGWAKAAVDIAVTLILYKEIRPPHLTNVVIVATDAAE
jgi:hypothetical protein